MKFGVPGVGVEGAVGWGGVKVRVGTSGVGEVMLGYNLTSLLILT